jgi:N-acetylglucosamine-6-phosphate deacetylase
VRILGGVGLDGDEIDLFIDRGRYTDRDDSGAYLDAGGLTVAPGFVDLQVNGAFGFDITTDPSSMWDVGRLLPRTGVTSFCPTIITSAADTIEAARTAIAERPDDYLGAEPLGLHIEGPHLSPMRRGTHPEALLNLPGSEPMATAHVAIVTIAPELPGAIPLIEQLSRDGVVVSIGHSDATAEQALAATNAGATLGTHLFNAMPPITAREPGIAGHLLTDERTWFDVISDGHHLHPTTLSLAWRAARDRIVIITDATAAAGMPDGRYRIGEVEVFADAGAVRNLDGTLAGSATTMDGAVRIFAETTGARRAAAVYAASSHPADALGRKDIGRLHGGARADLILLDGFAVVGAVVGGELAHLADHDRLQPGPGTATNGRRGR